MPSALGLDDAYLVGGVINDRNLLRHRTRAGLRLGAGQHVDLVRYVALLVQVRHTPNAPSAHLTPPGPDLAEAATGAVAISNAWQHLKGHGQKLTRKQEALIAALFTEPNYTAAAIKAGVSRATLCRWL